MTSATDSKSTRREFFWKAAQGVALASTGGLVWALLLQQQARATPFALRPPGALAEKDFNATCIKCGQCVVACPYDTLALARVGDSLPVGTPFFIPRDIPCYMCPDIPCQVACPTGALDPGLKDIAQARMGLAVVDIENCLSWQGLRCEICYRECPLQGKAISIANHPRQTSKHALFVPLVHSSDCTGCGICEKACPTQEAAIKVLEARLVQGKIGDHYLLGRDATLPGAAPSASPIPVRPGRSPDSQEPATDYLNQGEL